MKLQMPPKGGVAVLPLDIMAEAHARVKEREQKINDENVEAQVVYVSMNNFSLTSAKLKQ